MAHKLNPHQVFQNKTDNTNWDKYVEQIDLIKLTKKQKKELQESIQFLRKTFGENFLKKCFYNKHPFMSQMLNAAPISRLKVIKFAKSIKDLCYSTGFETWVKKFKKTKYSSEFIEASTVLENAHNFYKAGFTIEFEPEIEVRLPNGKMRKKNPDLKITNPINNEEIFIEVSEMKSSDGQRKSSNAYHTIWWLVHHSVTESTTFETDKENNLQLSRHILPSVRILRVLENYELEQVLEEIKNTIELVKKTQKFQERIIRDMVEIAVAPKHEHYKVEKWNNLRNMRDFVDGPAIPMHETQRARIKIADKIKQLPEDKPSIIIIPTGIFMFVVYPVEFVISDLTSEIEKFPNLLFVSLYTEIGEGKKKDTFTVLGENYLIEKCSYKMITEKRIVVKNPAFSLKISKSSLNKILKAFKN